MKYSCLKAYVAPIRSSGSYINKDLTNSIHSLDYPYNNLSKPLPCLGGKFISICVAYLCYIDIYTFEIYQKLFN